MGRGKCPQRRQKRTDKVHIQRGDDTGPRRLHHHVQVRGFVIDDDAPEALLVELGRKGQVSLRGCQHT
jgi:hypothetical protein